jgi:hypothetical protein
MMIQEKIRQESLGRHFEHRAEDPSDVARAQVADPEIVGLTGPFGNSTQQEELADGCVVRVKASPADEVLP